MKECYIIYDTVQHRFYSESERVWSQCLGTFYPTHEAAREVMARDGLDPARVRTVRLFNS